MDKELKRGIAKWQIILITTAILIVSLINYTMNESMSVYIKSSGGFHSRASYECHFKVLYMRGDGSSNAMIDLNGDPIRCKIVRMKRKDFNNLKNNQGD